MSDARLLDRLVLRPPPAERLSREVGLLARRLEEVVAALPSADRELAGARAFLAALGDEAASFPDWLRVETGDEDAADETHPLDRLARRFGLDALDVQLLLLAGMPEEHEGLASTLAMVHPTGESRATVGLAAQLYCRSQPERWRLREALERGAAVTHGLLRVTGEGPFFNRSLEVAPRLWSALAGVDAWPAALQPQDPPPAVTAAAEWAGEAELRRVCDALREPRPRTVLIAAEDPDLALERAVSLARAAGVGHACVALPATLDADAGRLLAAHAVARGIVPILRHPFAGEGPVPPLDAAILGYPGPLILCVRPGAVPPQGDRPLIELAVGPLSLSARAAMWTAALPELAGEADRLSAVYRLEAGAARVVAGDVRDRAESEGAAPTLADVARAVRARSGAVSAAGVSLRRPTAGWADLVLPPDRAAQLAEAVDRLRYQRAVLDGWGFLKGRPGARGVRLLFSGPPGTGKTLAAEVLAHALGVDLLVVDLSRVVSKWLGETEKHLAEVFAAAERTQAVLLFDEADALFGRRTEVSDAHDRYANLETAYLLTRLERYEGLAVLATNLAANLDSAFIRRMEFVVEFDEPGPEQRREIWRLHLPAAAPLGDDVELKELAELFPVTGAVIRNAAVAAAFRAAADHSRIDRDRLVRAVWREYQKAGRAFPGVPSVMSLP